jgi:5-formaminoimidazole-4-carboxamide-1-beta-D-ribofuranosyl 5'-monophosphate synthetase
MKEQIDFTRINNDVNGNPRYVCHFLNFISDKDEFTSIDERYELALSRARKLGGRKFHNKQYGGGIVFQSYNIIRLSNSIHELVENMTKTKRL